MGSHSRLLSWGDSMRAPWTSEVPVFNILFHLFSLPCPLQTFWVSFLSIPDKSSFCKEFGKTGCYVLSNVLMQSHIANGPPCPWGRNACNKNNHHHQWNKWLFFFSFLGELNQAEILLLACMPHPGPSPTPHYQPKVSMTDDGAQHKLCWWACLGNEGRVSWDPRICQMAPGQVWSKHVLIHPCMLGVRAHVERETLTSVTNWSPVGAGSPTWGPWEQEQTVSSVTTQQESDSEEWLWLSHDDQTEERNEPERMEVLEMSMSISQLSEMGKAAVWFRNLPTTPGSSLVPSEELCEGKGFLAHTMPAEWPWMYCLSPLSLSLLICRWGSQED